MPDGRGGGKFAGKSPVGAVHYLEADGDLSRSSGAGSADDLETGPLGEIGEFDGEGEVEGGGVGCIDFSGTS